MPSKAPGKGKERRSGPEYHIRSFHSNFPKMASMEDDGHAEDDLYAVLGVERTATAGQVSARLSHCARCWGSICSVGRYYGGVRGYAEQSSIEGKLRRLGVARVCQPE